MAALKTVTEERQNARVTLMQSQPEDWVRLREAANAPASIVPERAARLPLSARAAEILEGVEPANRPRPGQQMRPMTKRERSTFRRELRLARGKKLRQEATAYRNALKAMSDDQVLAELKAKVMPELLMGSVCAFSALRA